MKQLIIGLYTILTVTIANNRFYLARMLGCRSELELRDFFIKKKKTLLDGGQFIFMPRENLKHRLLYITITKDEKENYIEFYKNISKIPIVSQLFFITYSSSKHWKDCNFNARIDGKIVNIKIPQPNFTVYGFKNGKFEKSRIEKIVDNFEKKNSLSFGRQKENKLSYLSKYAIDSVESVYSNRFFLDVILREYRKGMIDFDGILKKDENYLLLESKEKDAGGNEGDKYFGWDSRRLPWYLYIKNVSGLETFYVIREVDNQTDRNFVDWRCISLNDFSESASWLSESGGGGNVGTITCPVGAFKSLKELL